MIEPQIPILRGLTKRPGGISLNDHLDVMRPYLARHNPFKLCNAILCNALHPWPLVPNGLSIVFDSS